MESQKEIAPSENDQKNEDKPVILPQKEKNKMTCMSITCWIFQVIIWIGAIALLFIDVYEIHINHHYFFEDTVSEYVTVEFILVLTLNVFFTFVM